MRRADTNSALEDLSVVLNFGDSLLGGGKDLLAAFVEDLAFPRALERACIAQQQAAAQILLEALDSFASSRLADVEVCCLVRLRGRRCAWLPVDSQANSANPAVGGAFR
jgi:hypothetical protein